MQNHQPSASKIMLGSMLHSGLLDLNHESHIGHLSIILFIVPCHKNTNIFKINLLNR